ncbi:class I SAM-dependent methyltransferase [Jiangella endophytica]|uniref:class I SAM-dependent methyltransferase n=1 Tax=Jiangella endophytica TaxID=1623398 RepID=UPI000E34BEBD|nr:class I SAM-dependent methyltransferase [Jiangella endophytica]
MATVPVRKVALVVGAAAAAASLVTLGVVLAGEIAVSQGLLLVVAFGLTAAVAVLGALVVQLKRSVSAVAARHTRQLSELHQTLRGTLAVNAETARAQGRALDAAVDQIAARLEPPITATGKRLDEVGADVAAGRWDTAQTYWQIEALLDLRTMLQPRALMPPLRDWAASPDVLRWLAEYVLSRRPELIVECGSGASSLVLGYAAQKAGRGRVVALEHDAAFAEVSARRVADHGLQDVVEVRHAPLAPWAGPDERDWNWYDLDSVKDLDGIGLVFVDGPPAGTGPLARYPALPVLLPHCADEVTFVLDDTIRPDEVEVSGRWLQERPEFVRQQLRADKGMHVLTRRPGDTPA